MEKNNTLKVFTAFSGYDSQCLALDRLGIDYELVGWSEIDKYAIKAHNLLYPQYSDRNYGDISNIDWSKVNDFELFTYSSPCQDFSVAGKQKGGEKGSGTRSSLLWECERAIEAKRPNYLLMENVAALVCGKFIRLFNEWQLTLSRLGYVNYCDVLNAKDFGVPQNRERVFLVSIRMEESFAFYFPKKMSLERKLSDILEDEVDEKYYLSDVNVDFFTKNSKEQEKNGNGFRFSPTDGGWGAKDITTRAGGRIYDNFIKKMKIKIPSELANRKGERGRTKTCRVSEIVPYLPDKTCFFDVRHLVADIDVLPFAVTTRIYANDQQFLKIMNENTKTNVVGRLTDKKFGKEQNRRIYDPEGIAPACRTFGGGGQEPKIVLGWSRDAKGNVVDRHPVEVANCVTAAKRDNTQNYVAEPSCQKIIGKPHGYYTGGEYEEYSPAVKSSSFPENNHLLTHDYKIRKLTPRECFRLMGVADNEIDKLVNGNISNAQLYKLAGNSIVVDVLYHIFRKMFVNRETEDGQLILNLI